MHVYRRPFDYAQHYQRFYLPKTEGVTFVSASFTFNAPAFVVTGTPSGFAGAASIAHRPRIGVYRKSWNYAERNALVEITWIEQAATSLVDIAAAHFTFVAPPFNFLAAPPVSFKPQSFTWTVPRWAISGATNVVPFNPTAFLFSANSWTISGQAAPIVVVPPTADRVYMRISQSVTTLRVIQ